MTHEPKAGVTMFQFVAMRTSSNSAFVMPISKYNRPGPVVLDDSVPVDVVALVGGTLASLTPKEAGGGLTQRSIMSSVAPVRI